MAFERSPHDKEHPYTRISNHILNDTYLDVKDKGLMACILSLPEDWKFSESGLSKRFGMNRTTLRKSLKRLEEAGYLKRIQQARNSKGKFVAADWTVIECPTRVQILYSPWIIIRCPFFIQNKVNINKEKALKREVV